jgi:hypothetical protein
VRRACLLADDGMLSRIWIRISVGSVSIVPGVMLCACACPCSLEWVSSWPWLYLKLEGISPSMRNEK